MFWKIVNTLNNILVSGLTVGVSSEYDKEVNERDDLRLRWIKHLNYCSDYELNKYSDEYNRIFILHIYAIIIKNTLSNWEK